MAKRTPEGQIKYDICEWLSLQPRCFFYVTQSQGIWDPRRRCFRKNNGKYNRKGVSDIAGIWQGRPLYIEVKAPKGTVRQEQLEFIEEVHSHGGIAFVARSVQDVIEGLFEAGAAPQSH